MGESKETRASKLNVMLKILIYIKSRKNIYILIERMEKNWRIFTFQLKERILTYRRDGPLLLGQMRGEEGVHRHGGHDPGGGGATAHQQAALG